jgi:putative cell wall-binding protein
MHRSRLTALVLAALPLVAILASPSLAHAETASWSPRLGYVLTTGSVRSQLSDSLHLSASQEARLRTIGYDLERKQAQVLRRSDLVVMNESLTDDEKRAIIAANGYNGSLEQAETSAVASAAEVVGMTPERLSSAVDEVWQTDAATHVLETELGAMGVTPQSVVGGFHVYATRFYDEYTDVSGVALPDKYVKFANKGQPRPAGYPDGLYAVSLYWDGVHHSRDNNAGGTVTTPHSVASAKVVDVGPWNTDDNYWNSYGDPQRPRRINTSGIAYHDKATGGGGPDFLASKPHLAFGLPESQAAYFNYYGRPSTPPAHTTAWENYWDKARGYGGQWSGADQFGRQVTQPAAVDLTPPCYASMGMTDNEWIDIIPLWEARLSVTSGPTLSKKPYFTGQDAVLSVTVKNAGSLTGTWQSVSIKANAGTVPYTPSPTGSFTLAPGASRTFTFTHRTAYRGSYGWQVYGTRAGATTQLSTTTVSFSVANRFVTRLQGATRYETAVKASQASYPASSACVVIATGLDFPDALAGAPLAKAEKAPLLLTTRDALPTVVRTEIARLHATKAIILGGTKSVSAGVADEIAGLVGGTSHVSRMNGSSRFDTTRLIAEHLGAMAGSPANGGSAVIASGRDYPDALSGAVLAAEKGWPVLLVEPSSLPTPTAAALAKLGTKSTIVLGNGIGSAVWSKLPVPRRIAGADRWETAALVGDEITRLGAGSFEWIGLASSSSFPDALAGGVLAVQHKGVMLLSHPAYLPNAPRARLASHRTLTGTLELIGSERALSATVMQSGADALR